MFPPQARGWTLTATDSHICKGVSPAGAGMDPILTAEACEDWGFPRRRGDGPNPLVVECILWSFPPQARGWTA